jgi:hypothetical protein
VFPSLVEVNDLAASHTPVRGWKTTIAFALIAAVAGMGTLLYSLVWVIRAYMDPRKQPYPEWMFFAPFLVGGLVAAVAYLGLGRIFAARTDVEPGSSADNTTLARGDHGSAGAKRNEPGPSVGPLLILLIIVCLSALIMGGTALLFSPNDWDQASGEAMFGARLGLLIGLPPALIVWVVNRRRRRVAKSNADSRAA